MKVSIEEFQSKLKEIIDWVAHGEEVTITSRGKALAQIIPVAPEECEPGSDPGIFGMWKSDHQGHPVEDLVRDLRKTRSR